jgi:predicted RNA methylase
MLKAGSDGIVQVAPASFFKEFVEERGRKIRAVYAMVMSIPYMFSFHTKKKHEFIVDLYVIDG